MNIEIKFIAGYWRVIMNGKTVSSFALKTEAMTEARRLRAGTTAAYVSHNDLGGATYKLT